MIQNGKLLTMGAQGIIENGTVLIKDGKIKAVGKKIKKPKEAELIDAEGMVVTPGFIDAHTHLGVMPLKTGYPRETEANESTEPVTPELRALDGLNPLDPAFKTALSGGVTSVMVLPGSPSGPNEALNVIAGLGVVVKCYGKIVDKMIVRYPAGLKIALGDRPKKTFSPSQDRMKMPSTRMGVAALIRTNLTQAKTYIRKLKDAEEDPLKEPERDLRMDSLASFLNRDFPARIHAYRADDIYTAIRLMEEFNFEMILDHGTEAHILVSELVDRNIPVILGPLMHGKSFSELEKLSPETPAILAKNGIKFAISTDHPARPIEYLNYHAALAARAGLDWLEALKAITIYPAEIMNVADRLGSLEIGKDADIVIFEDDPLEPLSRVEKVYINGEKVYTKS